jgi:simple sugar transport system substrate-binding protein/ribose transport system substrate-binding protein
MQKMLKTFPFGLSLLLGLALASSTWAQNRATDDPVRDAARSAMAGKTVVFVPSSMAFDLAQGWYAGMKKELEPAGMKMAVRDPNWSLDAGAQALTALITEKPAVIVLHNPDLQTYAALITQAESAGIFVVQNNMRSQQPSSVYVGADFVEVGEKMTMAVVDACKGKSNKIAVVQGAPTAAVSADTLRGVENVLARNPQIKVVSNQPAGWDSAKAKAITQSVLQQHPDLCGIVGFWDGMDVGTAAAVKDAGLTGKVFLATSGGGKQEGACDPVKAGAFDYNLSYDVPTQSSYMAAIIKSLVQGGVKPGAVKQNIYTTLVPITKRNAGNDSTCWKLAAAQ